MMCYGVCCGMMLYVMLCVVYGIVWLAYVGVQCGVARCLAAQGLCLRCSGGIPWGQRRLGGG